MASIGQWRGNEKESMRFFVADFCAGEKDEQRIERTCDISSVPAWNGKRKERDDERASKNNSNKLPSPPPILPLSSPNDCDQARGILSRRSWLDRAPFPKGDSSRSRSLRKTGRERKEMLVGSKRDDDMEVDSVMRFHECLASRRATRHPPYRRTKVRREAKEGKGMGSG